MSNKELQFSHTHLHTVYSLLDGSIKIDDLMVRIKELGMDSVAITDHGSMFGVVDFYKSAKKHGVHPVIGQEFYLAPGDRREKSPEKRYYHLVLFAENQEGYKNLSRMSSQAYIDGVYYNPRIDKELLRKHSEGVIATSSCISGEIPDMIINAEDPEEAYKEALLVAQEYIDILGKDNFYIELQDHGIEEQKMVNPYLVRIAKELDLKIILANDAHYLNQEDAKLHDILLCVQNKSLYDDPNRMKFDGDDFYVKSKEEIFEVFTNANLGIDVELAMKNTYELSHRCKVDFEFGKVHLPAFPVQEGYEDNEIYLRDLVEEGLKERYEVITDEIRERAEYELDIIVEKGFVDYYLIVQDYVNYAKSVGIYVGPGRGSGAGSLVAYAVGITGIDTMGHQLIFERFLNPERKSMPDFDIDFEDTRRHEVIEYAIEKYGEDHIANILTLNTFKARQAIADVASVFGVEPSEAAKFSKALGDSETLEDGYNNNEDFSNLINSSSLNKEIYKYASQIQGIPRHTSVHAAGIIISNKATVEYAPIIMTKNKYGEKVRVVQFPMEVAEETGLIKMDFLGLRTMGVIAKTVDAIKRDGLVPADFEMESVPLDDKKTYDMLSRGDSDAVFQLESGGMKSTLRNLRPKALEDLIAIVALYRPGPMDNIPKFVANKNRPESIEYLTPELEPIIKETYGIIVYQEQVMQIFRELAGFSMGRADIVRKAMGSKNEEIMAVEADIFINGLVENGEVVIDGTRRRGISDEIANELIDQMTTFAQYAFNKSHAAGYAYLAYWTAYLKANFPNYYMAATLTSYIGKNEDIQEYVSLASSKLGIKILPPNINESIDGGFNANEEGITFGINGLSGVGESNSNHIVDERLENGEYLSYFDFIKRTRSRGVSLVSIDKLIKSGALDIFNYNRRTMVENVENLSDAVKYANSIDDVGLPGIFDGSNKSKKEYYENPFIHRYDEYTSAEIGKMEKEITSVYLSYDPLESYTTILSTPGFLSLEKMYELLDENKATILHRTNNMIALVGVIEPYEPKLSKKGNRYAMSSLSSASNRLSVLLFEGALEQIPVIEVPTVVCISGKLDIDDMKLLVYNIDLAPSNSASSGLFSTAIKNTAVKKLTDVIIEEAERERLNHEIPLSRKFDGLYILVDDLEDEETLRSIIEICERSPGSGMLTISDLKTGSGSQWPSLTINLMDHDLYKDLVDLLGGQDRVKRFRRA